MVVLIAAGCSGLLPLHSYAADSDDVRTHAAQSFNQLTQHTGQGDSSKAPAVLRRTTVEDRNTYSSDQYLVGKGHMVGRVRERLGSAPEQDVEVTREEIVQEYLQGVKIVDRQIDEDSKTCSAIAVMPKGQIGPKQSPDTPEYSLKP